MHVLPRVREIEERYADSVTVIGVHSGKFVTERITERIAEARDRLDVVHAVVNDRQFRVWRDFAVEAWPTLVLIDPEGYIASVLPGETSLEDLAAAVERIAQRAESRGTLRRGADPLTSTLPRHEGTLRFPTRAVIEGDRIWVSDTGHGRVLECRWDGSDRSAQLVASYEGFVEPRGLARSGGATYLADRAGHSIWRLHGGEQKRVAGTGQMGVSSVVAGDARFARLRSPWGLCADGSRIAVAMAGTHQIWSLDPEAGDLALVAGTGGEAIVDGPLNRAALAQPTGLALRADTALVFADCETSAVREADAERVRTFVGTDLFEFGDRDGRGDRALLQHCEDVAVSAGHLAVADTYNDRLKRIDPVTLECAPWPGEAGEKGALREPAGVFADSRTVVVADTGHHRLVVVEADGSLTEVKFG